MSRKLGSTVTKLFIKNFVREKLNGGTTESVLFDLIELIFPWIPVIDKLNDIEVSFIFGDRDWMDSVGAEVIISDKINKG